MRRALSGPRRFRLAVPVTQAQRPSEDYPGFVAPGFSGILVGDFEATAVRSGRPRGLSAAPTARIGVELLAVPESNRMERPASGR
jgi:hypothetical protein